MRKTDVRPIALFVFGLWILWGFGYQTVWVMLQTEISGVVLSSRDEAHHWYEHGCSTRYLIRGGDNRDRPYLAGATDASLLRDMPVGTTIIKQRGHLDYEKNGQPIHFPIGFYVVTLILALTAIVKSLLLWRPLRLNR